MQHASLHFHAGHTVGSKKSLWSFVITLSEAGHLCSVSHLFTCLYIPSMLLLNNGIIFFLFNMHKGRNCANIAHHCISSVYFSVWRVVSVQYIFV